MNDLYKQEIIDPGDRASALAKEICFHSHNNCQAVHIVPHQPNNFHLFQAMMEGYGSALNQTNLVNITGEVAIMKHSITAFCDINSDEQLILT